MSIEQALEAFLVSPDYPRHLRAHRRSAPRAVDLLADGSFTVRVTDAPAASDVSLALDGPEEMRAELLTAAQNRVGAKDVLIDPRPYLEVRLLEAGAKSVRFIRPWESVYRFPTVRVYFGVEDCFGPITPSVEAEWDRPMDRGFADTIVASLLAEHEAVLSRPRLSTSCGGGGGVDYNYATDEMGFGYGSWSD